MSRRVVVWKRCCSSFNTNKRKLQAPLNSLRRRGRSPNAAAAATRPHAHARSWSTSSLSSADQARRAPTAAQPLHVLRLSVPVLQQLRVEEALFRADTSRNWLVLNHLASQQQQRAVVLGYAGGRHPEQLVHTERARQDGVPLIRRFSGGGTVFVDHNTVLVGFVVCNSALPHVERFPRAIMQWSAELYGAVFRASSPSPSPSPQLQQQQPNALAALRFSLQEHDYCFGRRKFGGNAQSIGRTRWLHHTSFLWDYDDALLERYLRLPHKRPEYRGDRNHSDFLCRLRDVAPLLGLGLSTPASFMAAVLHHSIAQGYFSHAVETPLETPWLQELLASPHDQRTTVLS